MRLPDELADRLKRYADVRNAQTVELLGEGKDGQVVRMVRSSSSGTSAVKIFFNSEVYERERDAYFRLQLHDAYVIRGLNIPQLIDFDDILHVIELSIVQAPYIVDFASAYLDEPPDFGSERLEEDRIRICDLFEDRANDVFAILDGLQHEYGIWYFDAQPGNINFGGG
jgi:hypothetical protein